MCGALGRCGYSTSTIEVRAKGGEGEGAGPAQGVRLLLLHSATEGVGGEEGGRGAERYALPM